MALSGNVSTNSYDGRYYTLSWSASQNIPENYSIVNWTLSCAGGHSWYSERTLNVIIDGSYVYSKSNRVQRYAGTITSGSIRLNHTNDGKRKFSARLEVAVYGNGINCVGSSSWDLNNIPRQAIITSAPNFTDEDNPIVYYNNPTPKAISSLDICISFDKKKDNIPYRNIPLNGTSYTFNFTQEERDTLRKYCINNSNITVYFYLKTLNHGRTYYSVVARTLSIINANPTLIASAKDTSKYTSLTGNSNSIIKGFNNVEVSLNGTAYKFANIINNKITNGDTVINNTNGTITNTEINKFDFTIEDNRHLHTSETITMNMIDYIKPTCNMDITAPNAEGELTFNASGIYFNGSFGAVNNEMSIEYRYKANDEQYGEWIKTNPINSASNNYSSDIHVTGLDYRNTYTFQCRAVDKITAVESAEQKVKTIPIFDWGENDFNFNVPVTAPKFIGEMDGLPQITHGTFNGQPYVCKKYKDGTMELTQRIFFYVSCNQAWGNLFQGQADLGNFAVPFKSGTSPLITSIQNVGATGIMVSALHTASQVTDSSIGIVHFCRGSSYSNFSAIVTVTAIGQWE